MTCVAQIRLSKVLSFSSILFLSLKLYLLFIIAESEKDLISRSINIFIGKSVCKEKGVLKVCKAFFIFFLIKPNFQILQNSSPSELNENRSETKNKYLLEAKLKKHLIVRLDSLPRHLLTDNPFCLRSG